VLDDVALQAFASIEHRRKRQDHRCRRVFGEEAGELVEGAFGQGGGDRRHDQRVGGAENHVRVALPVTRPTGNITQTWSGSVESVGIE